MRLIFLYFLFVLTSSAHSQNLMPVGDGWAGNSINTVVFRKNSITSYRNMQFTSWYDASGKVMLAKRKTNDRQWQVKETRFTGNIKDAHNSISIAIDGDGYLHVAWDHHANVLHYAKSIAPGSMEFSQPQSMTGKDENKVTYPEFYILPAGDLLFLYRDGVSGKGNLVLNRYHTKTKTWERVNSNLLDGEGKRNAYWQACVDTKGRFHLSWVWRESADVFTNHDICYAASDDGGKSWYRSDGTLYNLPINAANAEYIVRIPQGSELINSTSMTTNASGYPFIVTYWREEGSMIPQYHLVYFDGKNWTVREVSDRKTEFSLSGTGTKKIPISRPQILTKGNKAFVIFRDEERGNKVSVYVSRDADFRQWDVSELTNFSVGQWEPSYDTERWRKDKVLDLFVQFTGQGDGEKIENVKPQVVNILEWKPKAKQNKL